MGGEQVAGSSNQRSNSSISSGASGDRREVDTHKLLLEKVENIIQSVKTSDQVDQIISALHSLAASLFFPPPTDPSASHKVSLITASERNELYEAFYSGSAFPTLARLLLYDVASDWLVCFPISSRMIVYDVFFVSGRTTEVVQALVPCLQQSPIVSSNYDVNAVITNAERLLVMCLIENEGVLKMVREFAACCQLDDLTHEQLKQSISRSTQLVTSIPDKTRFRGPHSFSSHMFFKQTTSQLLAGAVEWDQKLCSDADILSKNGDGVMLFIGEAFARICRRGSADVLLSEVIVLILANLRGLSTVEDVFRSKPGFRFWSRIIEAIKDPYSVERLSEQLLHQLATQSVSDGEGYWILWILFHRSNECQASIRTMFLEKFLLWKVFPICCLRWILHFAVLKYSPDTDSRPKSHSRTLFSTVQKLALAWSTHEFVQSASVEQQAYTTSALGLCLEKMSKEDLDATENALHAILQGVSFRLESPIPFVRRTASSIALVFSKVIDPQNPLYLDDSHHDENIDWGFGLVTLKRGASAGFHRAIDDTRKEGSVSTTLSVRESNKTCDDGTGDKVKSVKKNPLEFKLVDPDEIIDPAILMNELMSDEENGDASKDSDASSDSSLLPYDLSDDDTDIKRNFSQLVDVIGALRKLDDPDGVECALNVVEKLVRASPDELMYVASDLIRALVQVRCSDLAIQGEEDSTEEKRQKALIALVVTCPVESLDSLNKLLYSSTIDISQRILILDVMTDAAQELANSRTLQEHRAGTLISSTGDQPWFMPRETGHIGAGPWKEIPSIGSPLNFSYSYERELPPRAGQIKRGKTRRWNFLPPTQKNQLEYSNNRFPEYAAAFILPAMQGFDRKRHCVDLLGRDFIVLGKLIYMLGVCIKCAAMHPEASVLASPLLDMLSIREVSNHVEAYVRRSVLFAVSCVLVALHPSHVASAIAEGNAEISKRLEWVRTWAIDVTETDSDRECYTLAMTCLQLHAEMALQVSRALDSARNTMTESVGFSNIFMEQIKLTSPIVEL